VEGAVEEGVVAGEEEVEDEDEGMGLQEGLCLALALERCVA